MNIRYRAKEMQHVLDTLQYHTAQWYSLTYKPIDVTDMVLETGCKTTLSVHTGITCARGTVLPAGTNVRTDMGLETVRTITLSVL